MKRIIALIVCLLMTATMCLSCANENGNQSDSPVSAPEAQSAEQSEDAQSQPEADPIQAILNNPDIYKGSDYNGRTFTFWTCGVGDAGSRISEFVYNENISNETLPETVNTAIKTRNDNVYESLGVTVKEIYYKSNSRYGSDSLTQIRNFINGGTDTEINCFSVCLYDCGTLALENGFYDLNSLNNINTENPWWEQSFNDSVTIANQLYFTLGDIGFASKESTPCVYYNQSLIGRLGQEDPLALAKRGDWTIDAAITYTKCLSVDSAEPVGMDYRDQFGWAGQYDDMYSMLYGSGTKIVSRGADGYPIMSLKGDTAYGTVDKVMQLMNLESYMCGNDYFNVSSAPMLLLEEAFEQGRCLFYSGGISTAKDLQMDDTFGILPVPKYTAEQDSYYSLINTWVCNAYGIGSNLDEEAAEFSAAVLDVMGYYSWMYYDDSLAFNYYEKMLKSQKLPTDDAEDMLDLIFQSRGCELGAIFQIGKVSGGKTVNDVLIGIMSSGIEGTFSSQYEAYADSFQQDIDALVEAFEANKSN